MSDRKPLVLVTGELEQIDAADDLVIGGRLGVGGVTSPASLVEGEGVDGTTELRWTRVSEDTGSPRVRYRKARGTPGSEANVASGDILGTFTFHAYRNGAYQGADTPASCMFFAEVTGAPSGNSVPGDVVFNTTDVGQTLNSNAVRISHEAALFVYVSPANNTPTTLPTNAAGLFSKDANAQLYSIEEDGTVWHLTGYGVLESDGVLHVPSFTTVGLPAAGTAARVAYNSTEGQLTVDNGTSWSTLNQLIHVAVTTTATITNESFVLADATSAAFTITLPTAASTPNKPISIKKTDASGNSVTIDGDSAETIDGATTQVLTGQYDSITIVSDGTEWWII